VTAPETGPSPAHMRAVAERYGAYMSAGNVDGIVALYAPDGVLEDPIGTPPHRGHAAIRAFYAQGFKTAGGGFSMVPEGATRIAGRHAATAYIVRVEHGPEPFMVETLDVMIFDEHGLITSMVAYFGPSNVHPLRA